MKPPTRRTCASKAHPEATARWYPVLLVRADQTIHGPHPPARMSLALPLCDECKRTTRVADLVNDAGWARIVELFALQRRAAPVRETAQLTFIPLDSAAARRFDRDRTRNRWRPS